MNDLWRDLNDKSEARDTRINTIRTTTLARHTGRIQPKLQKKLSKQKCTLARLLLNRPGKCRRASAYKEKAGKVIENTLTTILEDRPASPELPKMPPLSSKTRFTSWIKKSIQVCGKYIASDLVDASIKARFKKIRQRLWSCRKTGEGVGMVVAGGHGPSRSDLQSLSLEVTVMLFIESSIANYTQILEGSLVGATFRPRVVEIVGILNSYKENQFQLGALQINTLSQFDKEIQEQSMIQAQAESLLAYASES